jgi:hypothetical protein
MKKTIILIALFLTTNAYSQSSDNFFDSTYNNKIEVVCIKTGNDGTDNKTGNDGTDNKTGNDGTDNKTGNDGTDSNTSCFANSRSSLFTRLLSSLNL